MRENINKVLMLYRELGLGKTVKLVITALQERAIALFYEKIDDVIISWDLHKETKFKPKNGLAVEDIDDAYLPQLREFCENKNMPGRLIRKFENYLDNDFKGFAVRHEGEMVGFMWWVNSQIPVEKNHPALRFYEIGLRSDELYMFDNFLIPEYRGNANSFEALFLMRERLKEKGYNKAYAYVRASNRPARWIYKVQGWQDERNYIRHKFFRSIMVADSGVFIKNSQWSSIHKFDYRYLFSMR